MTPDASPAGPTLDIAVQAPGNLQPTNKVSAAANAAGGIGAVVGGVMAGYGGPAIVEALGKWGETHPSITSFVVMMTTGVIGALAVKYGGQRAAYNVLDKPNVALKPADQ
jgi:ammonia channel protein AmtB